MPQNQTAGDPGNDPVLVINSGSSSLKYQLLVPETRTVLAAGLIERIGETNSILTHRTAAGQTPVRLEQRIADHHAALTALRGLFSTYGPDLDQLKLAAVGHRVVHGGAKFSAPVLIDDDLVRAVKALIPLAPLHNPAAIAGIEAARTNFDVPQVAVFDTAFFADLPEAARTYAIPHELARSHQIRRYGFHGTSHSYVSATAAAALGADPAELNLIVFHLGNGASVSAVRGGRAVETSMGLTPLEGLVMGTRSGDIDPGLPTFLHNKLGLTIGEIDTLLNKESGLKGLAGENDFRALDARIEAGDRLARLAFEVYVHRLRHYLGAYAFQLGRLDAVVFTAGVGENNPRVRAATVAGLEHFGLHLDAERNSVPEAGNIGARSSGVRLISTADSAVQIMVVPTNEELAIALQTRQLVGAIRQ